MAEPAQLSVRDLTIDFESYGQEPFRAVHGVSFDLAAGESLAVVGESGSGKSVSALALTRLLPEPPARLEGQILWQGEEVLAMKERQLRQLRGNQIAYVFQEPSTSLNPVFTIRSQMAEVLKLHRPDVTDVDQEIIDWLYRVGIIEPEKRIKAYPHELSGGMQQRVMIAMALCCRPGLLVADEPTTALDVTIQKQIMDLLVELKRSLNMSLIMITHNFGIIRDVADKVAVMFRGHIVETGTVEQVLEAPRHPYTKALIGCVPRLGDKRRRLPTIDHEEVDRLMVAATD